MWGFRSYHILFHSSTQAKRSCCWPRGCKALIGFCESRARLLGSELRDILEQLAEAVDFSNFDVELMHSTVRGVLNACNGRPLSCPACSACFMVQDISRTHEVLKMPFKVKAPVPAGTKAPDTLRARYTPQMAFVADHRLEHVEEFAESGTSYGRADPQW